MRIVQLTCGSGDNFYCENCERDLAMIKAFARQGHEAVLVPMYLPVSLDGAGEEKEEQEGKVRTAGVFMGGVNVFLQEKFALFRRTPRWVDRVFDSRGLLRAVGKLAGMTDAGSLGEMTVSMLLGQAGRQAKEYARLGRWLAEERPDAVIVSNALLSAAAKVVKEQTMAAGKEAKVVCLLQDEHEFVDELGRGYAERCWELMRENGRWVDKFAAVSRFYADYFSERSGLERERIEVVYPGIELGRYKVRERREGEKGGRRVGYLGRMCEGKGLDVLAGAFAELKRGGKYAGRYGDLKLRIAGGMTGADKRFVEGVKRMLRDAGVEGDAEFWDGFGQSERAEFLAGLDVLCVPVRGATAFGLGAAEALASGVPVAASAEGGVFDEFAEQTEAVAVYGPNEAEVLAEQIDKILSDELRLSELSKQARKAAERMFDAEKNSAEMVRVIDKLR